MQAVPNITRCPICHGISAFAFEARFVEVMKCGNANCGHLFAANAAPSSGLQWVEEASITHSQYGERNSRLISRLIRDEVLVDGIKLLDFGAGTGHICTAIKQRLPTADIYCLEAHKASAKRLRAMGFRTCESEGEIEGKFDVVLMTEVVEHLDDPVATLKAIRSHVEKGGILFLTTPCGETRTGNRKTNAYDTKEHVHFFTHNSLNYALHASGFSNFELHVINELYPRATGWRRRLCHLKDLLRPARAMLFGHQHLTGWTRAI